MRTLLLGMGNPILTDDGVGVRLAADIETRLGGRPDLEFAPECSTGGLELLGPLEGFDRLIVLDSIRTRGGIPGEWYRFTAGSLRDTVHLSNVHDANFATALDLGRSMGMPLPPDEEIHIFAVEVEENATFSESLSASLAAAYPAILEEIFLEVRGLVEGTAGATPRSSASGRAGTRS